MRFKVTHYRAGGAGLLPWPLRSRLAWRIASGIFSRRASDLPCYADRVALRTAHGRATTHGSPGPRIEVLPADELPQPIPDNRTVDRAALAQRNGGKWTSTSGAAAGRLGAGRRAGRPSLVSSLGLTGCMVPSAQAFDPYRRKAASFRRAYVGELAAMAGGQCGAGPSSFVATAALQLAVSRYLYDHATQGEGPPDVGILREARSQGDSSRQNLMAAYEMAVREGRARMAAGSGVVDMEEAIRRAEAAAERRRGGGRASPDAGVATPFDAEPPE